LIPVRSLSRLLPALRHLERDRFAWSDRGNPRLGLVAIDTKLAKPGHEILPAHTCDRAAAPDSKFVPGRRRPQLHPQRPDCDCAAGSRTTQASLIAMRRFDDDRLPDLLPSYLPDEGGTAPVTCDREWSRTEIDLLFHEPPLRRLPPPSEPAEWWLKVTRATSRPDE
jgi:hypothetical protein